MISLAIIIPYFKIDYFEETLQSIENQSDKRFHVYIGDDNSPDTPELIIEKNLKTTKYSYIKFPQNLGGKDLTKQWHRCINLSSQEEWIMILGDDDVLEKDVVSQFYNNLHKISENNIEVIRYSTKTINKDSIVTSIFRLKSNLIQSKASFIDKLLKKERSSLSEHIFSRKSFEKNHFKNFPIAFGSDDVAWLEFSNFSNLLGIKDCYVLIRDSEINLSSTPDKKIGRERVKGIFAYNKYILQRHAHHFNLKQKLIIAAKAYNRLRHSNRKNYIQLLVFSLLLFKKVGIKNTFKIYLNNKNYQY